MQTILNGLAANYLKRELADLDARRLLDIGLVRAEDGSLHLAADPSVPVVARACRPLADGSWSRALVALLRPSRVLKTTL